MNFCRGCDKDFASVASFDAHRAGSHRDGRYCRPLAEFPVLGLEQDSRGRWALAAQAEHARRHFARTRTPLRAQGSDVRASDRREVTPDDPKVSEAAAAVLPIERSKAA